MAVCGLAEQLTPRLRTHSHTNPNDIYVGTVVLPGGRERARAYVKVFPPADRSQLVFNEVIGHHLAVQCELPSPFTFPCACPISLLRKATRSIMAPDARGTYVLGVASFDGGLGEIKQSLVTSEAVKADLMNWPQVARVAVFDELMGNDDRHLGNLIRRGRQDYLLIDHERILFGESWFNRDLDGLHARYCDANVLADTIAEGTDEVMRRRMLAIAQHFVMETILEIPEVAVGLEQLCQVRSGATARLLAMLNRRRTLLRMLMDYHLRKGELFRASSFR